MGKSRNCIIDSGATSHMTSSDNVLVNAKGGYRKYITTANNEKILSKVKGDVLMPNYKLKFENVLYIPDLITNLLSVSSICKHDCTVVFDKHSCKVYKFADVSLMGKTILEAPLKDGLYVVDPDDKALVTKDINSPVNDQYKLCHRRLGHLSPALMNKLRGLVDGFTLNKFSKEPCVSCCKGMQCVKKFPKRKNKRAKDILELIHTDLAGPMEEETWGGARYFLIFVDEFSRKVMGYMLKSKTEVFAKFKEFKVFVANQINKKIKKLRSDNGSEYINDKFPSFLRANGIHYQTSVAHTSQQNGVAERTIRIVIEKARCMLQDSGLSKKFWGETVLKAVRFVVK